MPRPHVRVCVVFASVFVCCGRAVTAELGPNVSLGAAGDLRDVSDENSHIVKFASASYAIHKGYNFAHKISKALHLPSWGHKKDHQGPHVVFSLYTRGTRESPEKVDSRHLEHFKTLKANKPVKLLIHGWKGYCNCTFFRTMVNGLLEQADQNVITVDWSGLGSRSSMYPAARKQVGEVARLVADFLDFNAASIPHRPLHVLGHSLGAQIAGVAGQLLTKGKIGRITGLDPAGPEFSLKDRLGRLCEDSAEFVDVIHTTDKYLGFGSPLGHVDFYPNGGTPFQPGCGVDLLGRCSHRRSYELFAESLTHPNGFPAAPCLDWHHFVKNYCPKGDKEIVYMGINTPKTARGKYYLLTNSALPYGKEKSGLYVTESS